MSNGSRFWGFTTSFLIIGWLLIALISTTSLYYQRAQSIGWWEILPVKMGVWFFWGVYAVGVFRLSRFFQAWLRARWAMLTGHLLTAVMSVLINVFFYSLIVYWIGLGGMDSLGLNAIFWLLLPGLFEWYFIIYCAIVIFTYAYDYYKQYRTKELQTLQLEKRLIQAQLQTLKMQLHPHFLFNTLNTIAAQVRLDRKPTAVTMLSGLSTLLRTSLGQRDRQTVSFEEELDFIRQYLDLEKERFSHRLEVEYAVGAAVRSTSVPAFLLQPIVENAVYHGLSKQLEARRLRIRAEIVGNRLQLSIYNDGPLLPPDFDLTHYRGIGLSNTLERLSQLYGADFSFAISNRPSGVEVALNLPVQNIEDE